MTEFASTFLQAAQYISAFSGIVAALIVVIKPIREWLFETKKYRDGMKCLLRGRMLQIYYRNKDGKTIRQYEYEDFIFCYKAYKSMKGNSFVDKIYDEIKKWEVVS